MKKLVKKQMDKDTKELVQMAILSVSFLATMYAMFWIGGIMTGRV